jgi:large conductance mechanosensitive channel
MAEKQKIIQKKEVTMSLPIVKVPGWLQGFIDFVREQGVVGVAVGLTLGLSAKSVVDSIVNYLLNPVIGVLTGGQGLATKYVCIDRVKDSCSAKLGLGQVASALLGFIVVAALVYFVVKGLKLDKLDKKKEE